ncbi:MAG: vitamin B12 transporter [Saprospiraceae bacterium]|jgi:vitamin B12 transporter
MGRCQEGEVSQKTCQYILLTFSAFGKKCKSGDLHQFYGVVYTAIFLSVLGSEVVIMNKSKFGFSGLLIVSMLFVVIVQVVSQDSLSVDDIVITGTRFAIPIEKSGKSIYKLSAEDISRQAGKSISDILNTVPGIQITGNYGTPGNNINYSSRGGKARQIVILIDGIPVSDPSGIESFYDLRLLSSDMIESIEVLKGGLSTLYGSGASTAVINIKLKDTGQEDFAGMVDLHGGSFGTLGGNLNLGGQSGKSSYMISGGYEHSDGFSAASSGNSTDVFDNDGFDRINTLVKYGYQFNNRWKIDLQAMFNDFDAEYDDGAFSDGDNLQLVDEFRIGVTPTYKYDNGLVKFLTSYSLGDRSFESSFPINYSFSNIQTDLSQEHRFSNLVKGFWGMQYQKLSFEDGSFGAGDEPELSMIDPYASVVIDMPSGVNVHAGGRLNIHSDYGSKFVYNLNPSWLLDKGSSKLKLRGSISTSYITPSLYQLQSPLFGNADLDPESSLNWEVGTSLYINEQLEFNIGYFNRVEKNPIGFESEFDDMGNFIGGMYVTAQDQRDVSGVEFDANWKLNKQWSFNSNYTFVTSDNAVSLRQLPKHKVNVGLEYMPTVSSVFRLDYNYTGVRKALDFATFSEVELDAFSLIDLYVQQGFMSKRLTAYVSINNLLDTDYVDVYGFSTRGRNLNIGIKWQF